MPKEVWSGLGRSGLVPGEIFGETEADIGVLSVGGRGESGMFHKLASSGRSSSESLYSSSSSLIDFRLGCHDPLLLFGLLIETGASPGLRGAAGFGRGLLTMGDDDEGLGDGDLDLLRLLMAVIANEGVDGLLKPLLGPPPFGRQSECAVTWPFGGCRFGYGSLFPALVSSRMVVMAVPLLLTPLVVVAVARGNGRAGFSMPYRLC